MGTTRMLILAVAAVSAMALAFIVKGMASGSAPAAVAAAPVAPAKPMTKVLVAKRDLPIGTRLTAEDLTWLEWPVDAVNAAFITDGAVAPVKVADTAAAKPADAAAAEAAAAAGKAFEATRAAIMNDPGGPIVALTGAIVKEPIFGNEPITDRKLVRAGQSGYMAVVLQPGMRAMAVPVSVETAAGGFILPGDRVDVLMTRSLGSSQNNGPAQFASETVMRNVRVLAVDQTSTPVPGANAVVGAVATIEVSPADAEALNLAQAQGDLSLTLRSYADITGPTGRTVRRTYANVGAPSVRNATAPPSTAAAPSSSVRVWRGGQATEVNLSQATAVDPAAFETAGERAAAPIAASK
jgi:pilus assembly protein CpaB